MNSRKARGQDEQIFDTRQHGLCSGVGRYGPVRMLLVEEDHTLLIIDKDHGPAVHDGV